MLTRFFLPFRHQARQMARAQKKVKTEVEMNKEVFRMIEEEEITFRRHPGRVSAVVPDLPQWLRKALQETLEDVQKKELTDNAVKLFNFLHSRHVPSEEQAICANYQRIRSKIETERKMENFAKMSTEQLEKVEHAKAMRDIKKAVSMWAPIQYNKYSSLLYLVARAAQDYAVITRIFREIAERDKEFQPKTLLDFGSGVGTTLWATSQMWPNSIQEHMCVDISTEICDVAEGFLKYSNPPIRKVFQRQYIPLSNKTYDIVVNAYTQLELPDIKTRLETISKLWARTEKYLVIVEQGTNAGFKVINEARDFVLHLENSRDVTDQQGAFVFSPCPHEQRCPRYGDRKDKTPCNFQVNYNPMPLRNNAVPGVERFCYVVLKKGKREDNWPRIVRPTMVRSKHTICRMCTANGKLEEIIFTASKYGKLMYHCARSSRWGDRLPIEISKTEVEVKEVSKMAETEEAVEKSEQKMEKENEASRRKLEDLYEKLSDLEQEELKKL